MIEGKPIPVILDTDIGDDIDDTWALAMLLKSPELDLRLVVTDYGNTAHRAKIVAKFLEVAGQTDVDVGVGIEQNGDLGRQARWVEDYHLDAYPGAVHGDGVGALIDAIMSSDTPVTLICIGPCPNIRAALEREPRISERARFVGMYGSVFVGYAGRPAVDAEWNVRADPDACRAAFAAPWEKLITPVDTCGIVRLEGDRYAAVRDCDDPVVRALMENYRVWADGREEDPESASSVLFDTVAVFLAFSRECMRFERTGLRVTDDGFTVPDAECPEVDCAVRWTDYDGYLDFLAARLVGRTG